MWPFRVFLSYSHEDLALVEKIAGALKDRGLVPLWDKDIRPGAAFTDAIKDLIVHAHVFVPVITEHARQRPWVLQETGYAIALQIPVLPLAVGNLPGEMIAQLQAISLQADLSDLAERLAALNLEHVVLGPTPKATSMVQVADYPEKRYELLSQCARRVIELGHFGRVRQRGYLSIFSVPDKDPEAPIWKAHDGKQLRSDYMHSLLRETRVVMAKHARAAGCDLVLDLAAEYEELDPAAKKSRLTVLLEFLDSMPDEMIRVVYAPKAPSALTISVGDWFSSESRVRSAGQGWRQTIITWHGPTVFRAVQQFDEVIEGLLAERQLARASPERSRSARSIGSGAVCDVITNGRVRGWRSAACRWLNHAGNMLYGFSQRNLARAHGA